MTIKFHSGGDKVARASEILTIARAELGVKEAPAGSNRVKYNTWYYGREVSGAAYPWCMVFVQWVFQQAGCSELLPARTASCGALMTAAKKAGLWVKSGFRPGDIVIYDFDGDGTQEHVGIVEQVEVGGVVAIEGNTGAGSDADGGQVQQRVRRNRRILGAVRPRYEEEKAVEKMDNTPGKYAEEAVAWAQEEGILKGDAKGDLKLHAAVTREQLMVFLHRLYTK